MDKHQSLYEKVVKYAKDHDDIRALLMNGSRVNPNITPDQYQDFDMVFYVKDFDRFMKNRDFIKNFGDIFFMQTKDDQRPDGSEENHEWYVYLIQFKDGTRLDLGIMDIQDIEKTVYDDSLTKVILDKDHLVQSIQEVDESTYYVQKPTNKDILMTVNEFYWVCPYVGKGMARNHMFYAIKHLDILRKEIERILDWWIGYQHDFKISVGKGKHRYVDLLPIDIYNLYTETYTNTQVENVWKALFKSIDLFDLVYEKVAVESGVDYHQEYKINLLDFIQTHYKNKDIKKSFS
ncbi:MAG: aminoglycoside 6-adenylyltransferase [Candidatus Izemoplasmatales bacterium]